MQSIVAIDIETTGLSEDRDAITEIGAVRFKGHRIEDEWSTLINPNRHIPDFISGLTGIDDAMVRQAPRLRDVVAELEAFAGDAPVIGHNVRFYRGFLQRACSLLSIKVLIMTLPTKCPLFESIPSFLKLLGKQLGI